MAVAAAASDLPAAPLAQARCALRTGDLVAADAALARVPDALKGYRALLAARVAVARDDRDGAAVLLRGVTLPGAAGGELDLLRAVVTRDVARLLALGPEGKLEAASLLLSGERDRAVAVYREVFLDAAPGGFDARAEAALREAGVDPLARPSDRAARLASLQRRNRVEEAARLASSSPPPTDAAGWTALGTVAYNGRDYLGALEAWGRVYGAPSEARGPQGELFRYALAFARTDDYDTAGVVYRRVTAMDPRTEHGDFAAFKLGYMEYDRGRCDAAVPLLEAHRTGWPPTKHLDETLWWLARCEEADGDTAGADRLYAELAEARPKSALAAGAAYWRARHRPEAEQAEALRSVAKRFPDSGYAWLVAERLHTAFPARDPVAVPPLPATVTGAPAWSRYSLLVDVGLRDWAAGELASLSVGPEHALAMADAWLAAGRVDRARALACKTAGSAFGAGDAAAKQRCWPRIEASSVEAGRGSVPASIVYGVMVAESALDPTVSSAVGARGLMQLMPPLGAELHQRWLPGTPYDPDLLYSAPYNALFGATHLADRAVALDGVLSDTSLPAVVASYNAGVEPVRRWALPEGAAAPLDAEAFVEAVGFVETRGYVKRVLGSAMAWRAVWGDRG